MAFMDDDRIRRAQRLAFLARSGVPDVFMPGAPPPAQATPSTPLPGTPMDRAVVAPQSESAVNPQYDEFAALRGLITPREFTPTGNKEIDAILTRGSQTRQAGARNILDILSKARMNPEEESLLNERRARTAKDLERLESDKKQEGWDALARAGLKMAQSNSPYFMQALASGLEAGIQGLDEAKLRREEKRSRLQAADEDLRLAVIRGRQSAQDRALSVYNAAIAAGETEERAQAAARKAAEEEATLPQRLEMAKLEVEGKRLDNKLTAARTVDALRGPSGGSSGGGGDGTPGPRPLPPGARAEAQGRLATAYSEQDEAYRDWVAAGKPLIGKVKEGTDEWSAASAYEAARGKVNNILKILGEPSLGPAPTRTGGQRITQAQRRAAAPRPAARPASSGSSLKKGDVVNGYRYKGGDPNDKKNWTKA
jgi:hypothetical protein